QQQQGQAEGGESGSHVESTPVVVAGSRAYDAGRAASPWRFSLSGQNAPVGFPPCRRRPFRRSMLPCSIGCSMKPNFALNLSHDGIGLYHRGKSGWLQVGTVALDDPDLGA